jgi:hypothetical protein
MLFWTETEGTFKSRIVVACNCTTEEISNLTRWIGKIKLNGREISLDFVQTNLDKIHPSDILLIWGYINLTSYEYSIKNYLEEKNGIIEVMDFDSAPENIQKEIFGIESVGDWTGISVDYDLISKPVSANNMTYQPYKIFYHSPLLLRSPVEVLSVPVEGLAQPSCPNVTTGNFSFNQTLNKFWVCNSTHIYFDTDQNNSADIVVELDEDFYLHNYLFHLNYINNYSDIGVSFRPMYNFSDFCKDVTKERIVPLNGEIERAFMYGVNATGDIGAYCVILNGTGQIAWLSDLRNNVAIEDDHKLLLASLILSASNKRSLQPPYRALKTGYLTSYLNIEDRDMFEVYKFSLGLGYPY